MPPANQTSREKLKNALVDEKTFATVLLAILIDDYGTDFFEWEPETLTIQVLEDYGVYIPEDNLDKIWGLVTALTTDKFYNEIEGFHIITKALTDTGASFSNVIPPMPEDMAWAITEVILNDPASKNDGFDKSFSPDVNYYMGTACMYWGYLNPTGVLNTAKIPDNVQRNVDTLRSDILIQESVSDKNDSDTAVIDQIIATNLLALIDQLDELPLQNIDKENWPKFMTSLKSRVQAIHAPMQASRSAL